MSITLAKSRRSAATLREVAKAAGVSAGTVSRVLNGGNKEEWASSARRAAEIREIAERLGYRPNLRARSLRCQKSQTIGLVYGGAFPLLDGVYSSLAQTIASALFARGYQLLFVPLAPDNRSHWAESLRPDRLDGCLALEYLTPEAAKVLVREHIPTVVINLEIDLPRVLPEDEQGTELLIRHLAGLGHRRVVFFAGEHPHGAHYSLAVRTAAFRRLSAAAGVAGEVFGGSIGELVARVRDAGPDAPTAVIAYQALQALPLQQALWAAGVKVPERVSLATFDDLPALRWLTPPMTALDTHLNQAAARASALLIDHLDSGLELPSEPVRVSQTLVVRDSTAPPRR